MEDDFVVITHKHIVNIDNKPILNLYYDLLPSKMEIKNNAKEISLKSTQILDDNIKYLLNLFFKNKRRLKYYYYNIK